ncbi:cell division cycle- protein [Microbotryomycetes sp. JL221]|nr:cell division cycle- protein [Microbotryomycetes sp. JL221]
MAAEAAAGANDHSSIGHSSSASDDLDDGQSFFVRTLYAYSSLDSSALSFKQNDMIEVMSTLPSGWWDGIHCENKLRGWFPSNYVEKASEEEAARAQIQMQAWWDGDENSREPSPHVPGDDRDPFTGGVVNDFGAMRKESVNATSDLGIKSRLSNSTIASEDLWVPKVTPQGELYYHNSRTGETSRDLPADGEGDGTWVDNGEDSSSAPTATSTPQLGVGRFESFHAAKESQPIASTSTQLIEETEHLSSDVLNQSMYHLSLRGQPFSSTSRKGRRVESFRRTHRKTLSKEKALRKASLEEISSPPPPPFVNDLEDLVMVALQELASAAGIDPSASNRAGERDRLAVLGDAVVNAVQTMLHACAAFDHQALTTALASQRSDPPTNAVKMVRSLTRRVTSSLSKMSLSVRAVWGLPELGPMPTDLDADDKALEPEGEEAHAAAKRRLLEHAAYVRDIHRQTELKLRSDIVAGIRDVQSTVVTFIAEFERLFTGVDPKLRPGGPSLLRAPLMLRGAFSINASALVLPGGGFGGQWRGNGFATLPTTETAHAPSSDLPVVQYEYPTELLTTAVASAVEAISLNLASRVTSATHLVRDLAAKPGNIRDSEALICHSAEEVQDVLSQLLERAEAIDLASSVDYVLSKEAQAASDDAGPSNVAGYRESVARAKALLADFEQAKQAIYDQSAQILLDVQDIFHVAEDVVPLAPSGSGAQPLWNSPLTTASLIHFEARPVSTLDGTFQATLTAAAAFCKTLRSLAAVAEQQAKVPSALRSNSGKATIQHEQEEVIESRPESRANGGYADSTYSQTSSHRSSGAADNARVPRSVPSRESMDSDFFFSSGGQQPASTSSTLKSAARGILGPVGAVWGRRRGSVETSNTSASSLADTRSPSQEHYAASLTASSSGTKLAKVPGNESIASSNWRSPTDPVPSWLGPDYEPNEVSFGAEGQVRGGTLRALVIAATSHEGRIDSSYLSAFLMTYRTFCTPYDLLDCLADRYMVVQPEGLTPEELKEWEMRKLKPVRARTANVIKTWVRDYMDTDIEPDVSRRIADFATNVMRDRVQSPQIIKVVEERMAGVAPRQLGNLAPGAPPQPIVSRSLRKIKLLDLDPLEIARQISIMDGKLFGKITPQECLGKAWPREFGSDSPNISAMIDMSNAVTRWVTETILAQEEVKKRATIIRHFILIAERCLALNNFSTLIHIIAGLNSTPIHRLRRTWENVSQKSMVSLGMLNNLMRPDKNYKEYREHLRRVTPPCVYLTDWTFIGDGNPDMLREKPNQINFNKRQKASELILMIKLHQSTTYNLVAVPSIAQFLQDGLYSSRTGLGAVNGSSSGTSTPAKTASSQAIADQKLYEISLAREPRERDDEKIARLLSESGFL